MANQDLIRKDYERAIKILNSMQWGSSFGHLEGDEMKNIRMIENCLPRIDLTLDQIDQLSIIHVAGTKGKGSTCAYVESILRRHGYKTGMFSSPHLIEVRERVCIGGQPVSKKTFASSFWHVFDKLQTSRARNAGLMPGYSAMTLLTAFHIFVKDKVDVVILEVGVGGEHDATNCIQKPVVCGVASLNLEHTNQLGRTLEENVRHKAGIAKKGVPLVSAQHQDSVMSVILERSVQRQCRVFMASPLSEETVAELGMTMDRQAINAALALQLCRIWMHRNQQGDIPPSPLTKIEDIQPFDKKELTPDEIKGLKETRFPGNKQIVKREGVTYYLDGTDTVDCMKDCVEWFHNKADPEKTQLGGTVWRTLVFGMKHGTSAKNRLERLTGCGFQRAAFCPHVISTTERDKYPDGDEIRQDPSQAKEKAQSQLREWEHFHVTSQPYTGCFPSIVSALWWAGLRKDTSLERMAAADLNGEQPSGIQPSNEPMESQATHVQVLVTGSRVIVGGALNIIKPDAVTAISEDN